jgi:hypothetical protein
MRVEEEGASSARVLVMVLPILAQGGDQALRRFIQLDDNLSAGHEAGLPLEPVTPVHPEIG